MHRQNLEYWNLQEMQCAKLRNGMVTCPNNITFSLIIQLSKGCPEVIGNIHVRKQMKEKNNINSEVHNNDSTSTT